MEYTTSAGRIINSDKDELHIEFKTVQPTGLLFHARSSGGEYGDYITVELVGGRLRYVMFKLVEVLAAVKLMWTSYTHPLMYLQRTATTLGDPPTLFEFNILQRT